jgi:hypothetical protein
MDWHHFWFCLTVVHDGHTGCRDLMWMADDYDIVTGILGLSPLVIMPVWIAVDEWRESKSGPRQPK